MSVRIALLGAVSITVDDVTVQLSRKTEALLAYLLLAQGPQRRTQLAQIFCREAQDPAGTLRWHLSRIRQDVSTDLLENVDKMIAVRTEAASVDVNLFEQGVADGRDLPATVALYREEFLQGMNLTDAPEFELWLLGERNRLRRLYEESLERLGEAQIEAGDFSAAVSTYRRLLQHDPLAEAAHARLIWLLAQNGRRDEALAQYDLCCSLLEQELAVQPTPELTELAQHIRAGRIVAPQRSPILDIFDGRFDAVRLDPVSDGEDHSLLVREVELAQLQQAWAASQVVMVQGDAGSGKTSLAQAFVSNRPGTALLSGRCYESTRAMPYRPWIDLLTQQLAHISDEALAQIPQHWIEQLGRLLPNLAPRRGVAPAQSDPQELLFAAIADYLGAQAQATAQVIFIDDLQWADETSLQLFHFVAQRLTGTSASLLIGACRSEEAADNPALLTLLDDLRRSRQLVEIALHPFNADEVDQLIARRWPALPPGYRTPHIRDTLLAQTGGNPLFLTELLLDLTNAEELPSSLPVPPSLRILIQRRMRQIPEDGRQVLEALAVLDSPATLDEAQAVSGRSADETEQAMELGLRRRLLTPRQDQDELRLDFAHDLMRTAVVNELSPLRRQRLHRRAALALEARNAPPSALAYHWGMAGDRHKEGAYAYRAGQAVAALGSNLESIRYFEQASRCLEGDDASFPPRLEWIRLLEVTARWGDAESVALETLAAAEVGGNRWAMGRVGVELARIARMQGENAKALALNEDALAHLRAVDDPDGISRALSGMGAVHWALGYLDQSQAYFEEQLRLDQRHNELHGQAEALNALGVIHMDRGNYTQSLACYEEQIAIVRRLQLFQTQLVAVSNMVNLYAVQGAFEEALTGYRWQIRFALQANTDWVTAIGLQRMGETYLSMDRLDDADLLLALSVEMLERFNMRTYLCETLVEWATCAHRQGRVETARRRNQQAADIAATTDSKEVVLRTKLLSAQVSSDTDQAQADLTALLSLYSADRQRADILYTHWCLAPERADLCDQAAGLYLKLHTKSPSFHYRRRYAELTGIQLAAPQLPPLPAFVVAEAPASLEPLLAQIDELLAQKGNDD
ncbi:AAA family ATPase [bacterium]|nr:AAA family ATPase [bacterium]